MLRILKAELTHNPFMMLFLELIYPVLLVATHIAGDDLELSTGFFFMFLLIPVTGIMSLVIMHLPPNKKRSRLPYLMILPITPSVYAMVMAIYFCGFAFSFGFWWFVVKTAFYGYSMQSLLNALDLFVSWFGFGIAFFIMYEIKTASMRTRIIYWSISGLILALFILSLWYREELQLKQVFASMSQVEIYFQFTLMALMILSFFKMFASRRSFLDGGIRNWG